MIAPVRKEKGRTACGQFSRAQTIMTRTWIISKGFMTSIWWIFSKAQTMMDFGERPFVIGLSGISRID